MGSVTMRDSELPGTETVQVEAVRPLTVYRVLDEMQKCLLALKWHNSQPLGSQLINSPNVRRKPCMAKFGAQMSVCVCACVCVCAHLCASP